MKLSIIVPVYNMAEEGKLQYCLDSLLAQTISDYEIIAVNDASTDASLSILREYEKAHSQRIRLVTYEKNKRQGGAKNEGLRIAAGEWIGFVDGDDWVAPDCYEKLLKKAAETGADVVGCDYNLVDRHTMETGKMVPNNAKEQTGVLDRDRHCLLFLRPGSMVIKIYKRKVLRENKLNFPENIFYEDNCAASLWSLYFTHFEKVEEPLYFYYQHQNSTVHSITEQNCHDRMKAAVFLYDECEKRGVMDIYRKEIEYRFIELYYLNTLFSYLSGVAHPRISFIRELRKGAEERFPNFRENPYYQKYTGKAEKELAGLQNKSDLLFLMVYRLRKLIWSLRAGREKI